MSRITMHLVAVGYPSLWQADRQGALTGHRLFRINNDFKRRAVRGTSIGVRLSEKGPYNSKFGFRTVGDHFSHLNRYVFTIAKGKLALRHFMFGHVRRQERPNPRRKGQSSAKRSNLIHVLESWFSHKGTKQSEPLDYLLAE